MNNLYAVFIDNLSKKIVKWLREKVFSFTQSIETLKNRGLFILKMIKYSFPRSVKFVEIQKKNQNLKRNKKIISDYFRMISQSLLFQSLTKTKNNLISHTIY